MQAAIRANEVVVPAPPFYLMPQAGWRLGRGPGAAGDRGDAHAHRQIGALDEVSLGSGEVPCKITIQN